MKLIVMKEVESGVEDFFIKFDTSAEHSVYKVAMSYIEEGYKEWGEKMMFGLLTGGCGEPLSDDDICYYFSPDEKAPEMGEEWELDGTKYIRTE